MGSRLLGLDRKVLLLASNANVGGPATACAMATAMGWRAHAQGSMIVGTLGYALGNLVGLGVGGLLRFIA